MKRMKNLFLRWWQQCRKHPVITLIIIVIILVTLIFIGYNFDGTGFSGGNQVTTSRVISGPTQGTVTQTEVYQQGKTLWDWLQLLIIPVVLAAGGSIITIATNRSEQDAAGKRDITEKEIAEDNQREASLQSYLDKMSELLLEKGLRNSKSDDEVQEIARVRTLTTLSRLDGNRKGKVLQFLYAAGLIIGDNPIIRLKGADLSQINLKQDNLSRANLSGANLVQGRLDIVDLSKANLSEANLVEAVLGIANLRGANLSGANLVQADLNRADLSRADLRGSALVQTDLRESDLSSANLSGTDLIQVDLRGAKLNGANTQGTNLIRVVFDREQLDISNDLAGTILSASSSESS